eukprot:scaffold24484_cov67-Skeletonema_dohrnii-CCMP3373.AAC.1
MIHFAAVGITGRRSADRTDTGHMVDGKREDLRSIFGPLSFCCPRNNSPPENDNAPKNEKCSMLQNAHFDAVVFIKTPKSQR